MSGVRWAADLGTYPAIWIVVAIALGRSATTWISAVGRAAAFFLAVVVGYYLFSQSALGFGWDGQMVRWLLAAVTGAPVVSWIGYVSDRPGAMIGAALAGVAAVILATGGSGQLLVVLRGLLPSDAPLRLVQATFDLAAAGFVVGVLPIDRETRLWAVALTLPGAWIAAQVIEPLYGRLLA